MKRLVIIAAALAGILMAGWFYANKKVTLSQRILAKPDSIHIIKGGSERNYTPSDAEFSQIYDSLEGNWSLSFQNRGKPLKILCLSSADDISDEDVVITFVYEEPVLWDNHYRQDNRKKIFHLRTYGFVVPEDITDAETDAAGNFQGAVLISEDEELFGQSNMYVHYYSSDFINRLDDMGF